MSATDQPTFADVLLPVPVPDLFTYSVPVDYRDTAQPGCRVIVPFGRRKVVTGVIVSIHHRPPQQFAARPVLDLLDEAPAINEHQMQLLFWIAEYYLCTPGEVLSVALPSGLKIGSQSKVQLHPEFREGQTDLTDAEFAVVNELHQKDALTYDQVARLTGHKTVFHLIKRLIQKGAVLTFEEVIEKYKPKTIKKVRLQQEHTDKKVLQVVMETLEKNPKQLEVLLKYLQQVPVLEDPKKNEAGIAKKALIGENISPSSYKTLVKNGILEEFEEIVSRLETFAEAGERTVTLNEEQQVAFAAIHRHFETKDTVLLHGITGSGKTEIYIDLINQMIDNGHQVLYLLPEIALTTQIVQRLRKVFGNKLGVYHSRFSDNERVEIWKGLLEDRFQVVVGVRSSIFLPFDNLGLIIIDEEHDTSFKQHDTAPRYNARESALVLARFHNAKTLLGSATPSIESYYNARSDKWGLVTLKERHGGAVLPDLQLANIRKARSAAGKPATGNDFTEPLIEAIREQLDNQQQVILFQNRRGYSPYLLCQVCEHIPHCKNCNVSLTYHLYSSQIRCHYCGYKEPVPTTCPSCGSEEIKTVGFGTERLEDDIKILFPEATVLRMDLDTTRAKHSYERIINDFSEGRADILVGTQMVTKGLDFGNVGLVGIFDIDRLIFFPDFRSTERAWQLITQVSGRAGRKDVQGKVVIQTANTQLPLFRRIMEGSYEDLYADELQSREKYRYPPFSRMIRLTIRNREKALVATTAQGLGDLLRHRIGQQRVLGPEAPLIDRIRTYYLREIHIKLERDKAGLQKVKAIIAATISEIVKNKNYKGSSVTVDVDPV